MKKQRVSVLVILTFVFAAFTLGFFLGRTREDSRIHVSVPSNMQTQPPEAVIAPSLPEETHRTVTFPININKAGKEEFMALPGIGEILADRILAYRDANGYFSTVEGLMNVEGIGEKRMEDILDFITVGG